MTASDPSRSATEITLQNVRDYVGRCGRSHAELAAAAGVDEKSIRLLRQGRLDPRATTLQKLEGLLPEGWRAGDPVPETDSDAAATSAAGREGVSAS